LNYTKTRTQFWKSISWGYS